MQGNVFQRNENLNPFVNKTPRRSFKTESQEELLIEEWESTTKIQQTISDAGIKRNQEQQPQQEQQEQQEQSKTNTNYNDEIRKAILRGDFTVYQGGDLNEFFGCETNVPKCVSEICLVNDHYILVKIPQMQRKNSESQQSILQVDDNKNDNYKDEHNKNVESTTKDNNFESGRKFSKYLRCGNNRHKRRISPICEEPFNNNSKSNQKPINTNWSTSSTAKEVFHSTSILQPKSREILMVKEQTNNSQTNIKKSSRSDFDNNSIDTIVEQSLKAPKTSMSNEIDLEVSARLETANADSKKFITIQSLPRPRRRLNFTFRWFLKPFRFRSNTTTKKKIHALVYKTYFVNWIKAESVTHSCKCQHTRGTLRRCRSALF